MLLKDKAQWLPLAYYLCTHIMIKPFFRFQGSEENKFCAYLLFFTFALFFFLFSFKKCDNGRTYNSKND